MHAGSCCFVCDSVRGDFAGVATAVAQVNTATLTAWYDRKDDGPRAKVTARSSHGAETHCHGRQAGATPSLFGAGEYKTPVVRQHEFGPYETLPSSHGRQKPS